MVRTQRHTPPTPRPRPGKQVASSARGRSSEPFAVPASKRQRRCTSAGPTEGESYEAQPMSSSAQTKSSSGSEGPATDRDSYEAQPMSSSAQTKSSSGSEGLHRLPAELSGARALSSFLKRTSQLEEHSGSSRFQAMFRDLKSDDGTRQIMALTELSEYLSFSSEEALIAFPMETFIPLLISLLEDPGPGDESAAQAMLLSCRCLFNVVDILPPTTRIITAAGGLPVLCTNLLNVAYIDVAELAVAIIERISEDQPLQVLKAGGLQAILTFLDFFQIAVQRQAVNAAALMLLPTPPPEVFDEYVRPALPTLAQLLQHADPQVLQSVCECWRRLLDNAIIANTKSRGGASQCSSRSAAKGKWRGGAQSDRPSKKDKTDEMLVEQVPSSNGGQSVLAGMLEEICPSNVLSHLLVLLSNGISSPSPHSSVVTAEVLYILAVLTNASDVVTREVLKQDLCPILRRMVVSMDLTQGGAPTSQSSLGLLRVLVAVASILPTVHLSDSSCVCDEKRLTLLKENSEQLQATAEMFLPLIVEVYEACMEPSTQSLCITLLLSFFLACREHPEVIKRSLDSTRLACFLANLLLEGRSRSSILACLLIVYELLERHPIPYSLLFVRHGVVRAVHRLATHEDDPQKRSCARAPGKAPEQKPRGGRMSASGSGGVGKARNGRSKSQLVDEAAHRVLASYFASSSHTGESAILRSLGKIAKQLRSSPTAVITAHREALNKLHDLLLTSDGITAFEFSCSGTASALTAFLFPPLPDESALPAAHSDRLRLFLECIVKSSRGAFVKLVRLSVAALQRIEQQPLTLFPTNSSLIAALPPHLRQNGAPAQQPGVPAFGKGGSMHSSSGDLPSGFTRHGRNHDAGQGASPSLSVLRLLAKPLRVRVSPYGSTKGPQSGTIPNFRTLLMPLQSTASSAAGAAAVAAGISSKALRSAASGASSSGPMFASEAPSEAPALPAASPATRLRNYLASKVGRKRPVSSTTSAPSAPWEKRSGKAESKGPSKEEQWAAWEEDEAMAEQMAVEVGLGEDGGGRHSRDRDRDSFPESTEAVLLVEPLALISALEDYIWEKHGPKRCGGHGQRSSACSSQGSQSASGTIAAASSSNLGGAQASSSTSERPRSSAAAAADRAPDAEASPGSPSSPFISVSRDTADTGGQGSESDQHMSDGERVVRNPEAAGPQRKRVQVYLNGHPLESNSSIVQAIVSNTNLVPPRAGGRPSSEESGGQRSRSDRFLVLTEDESNSEAEDGAESGASSAAASSQHCCSAIWGHAHCITYEFVDEVKAPQAKKDRLGLLKGESMMVVGTDFDALVQRHARIPQLMADLRPSPQQAATSPAAAAASSSAPLSAVSKAEEEDAGQSMGTDEEALINMLELLSALQNMSDHVRASTGLLKAEGQAEDEDFHCNSLTSKLLRQLSDPLAICTGSIPTWCIQFSGACRFLFPYSARRILHHSCNLGLSRALHHVQQRTLAQNAHSQEMQRRLEGEVAVANIPRQKVRISRQRILESAIKVMNLYGCGSTILEVEYIGEVGTGSGPTLEFYAQVADILRTSEPKLFRDSVPAGMLFPLPRDPAWIQQGSEEASQILERFRLLGQVVAKCILDNRLVDLQLHPLFWRAVLGDGPSTQSMLREVDPDLHKNLGNLRSMDAETLASLCVDFTLPGFPHIALKEGGADVPVTQDNVEEYIASVAEATLITTVTPQVSAFRSAFADLLSLETCRIWSAQELSSIIMGSSVFDDSYWTLEHLGSHIKAQHGYQADSRCFRDLLNAMAEFTAEQRRTFLTFVTGAPTLPVNGFAGLKPPLTVVKKESPPAPLTPDQFMPSVMTCANYLKLPEYSSSEILQQKMQMAMMEGQSAFLLS